MIATKHAAALIDAAEKAHVPVRHLGRTGGTSLVLKDGMSLSAERMREVNAEFFPKLMER